MNETQKKKYFAFISYSHKDSEFAKWLQHEFEYYELPSTLNGRDDLPKSFRPIFRDEDELAGGELKPQISEALACSDYLIVICSPNSAKSIYVDNEIREFINISNENRRKIFPFIVKGKPHQGDNDTECFTKVLLELSKDQEDPIELIAGDINATGKNHAFVKILAGTLKEKDIRFSDLWDRYELNRIEKERKERENRLKLQVSQSRFVAEKAARLSIDGDTYTAQRLCLEVLPKDANDESKPYVYDCELALRDARHKMQTCVSSSIASFNSVGLYSRMFFSKKSNIIYVFSGFNVKEIDCTNGKYIEYNLPDYTCKISYCKDIPEYVIINTGFGQKGHCYLYHIIKREKIILGFRKDGLVNAYFCSNGRVICLQYRDFTKLLEFKDINTDYKTKKYSFAYNETIAVIPEVELAVLNKHGSDSIEVLSLKSLELFYTIKIKHRLTRGISKQDFIANTKEFYFCIKINQRVIIVSFGNNQFKITKSCILSPDFDRDLSNSIYFIEGKGFILLDSKQVLLINIHKKSRKRIFLCDDYIIAGTQNEDFLYFATSKGHVFKLTIKDKTIKKVSEISGKAVDIILSYNHKYFAVLVEDQGNQSIKLLATENSMKVAELFKEVKVACIYDNKFELYIGNYLAKRFCGHRDIGKLEHDTSFSTFFSLSSNSNRILIWEIGNRKRYRTSTFKCFISDFTYCQCNNTLGIILRDGSFFEYDYIREEIIYENKLPHETFKLCLSSNEANPNIAIGAGNVLFIKEQNSINRKISFDDEISYLQYNHNATQIYVGCRYKGIAYIYDINSNNIFSMDGRYCSIYNITSNSSDNYIAIQTADYFRLFIVDLVANKIDIEIQGYTSNVVFDPYNRLLAACIPYKGVCLWDLHLHTLYVLDKREDLKALNFSSDGCALRGITNDGCFIYWETLTFLELVQDSTRLFFDNPLTDKEKIDFNLN